ncbi:MAG: DUF4330 domain-containing protein [Clostridia bacterium]|nr:DUF4330 domain-containing protein [Clostridia bacterium]
MKIIDEKGRLFGKINLIDLIIVVAVIVLSVATVVKFRTSDSYLSKGRTLEYTMLIENVRQATVDAVGQQTEGLVDYESKKEIGNIVDYKVMEASEVELMSDGTYKNVKYKDKFDVLLTVQVGGTETEDNYYTLSGKKIVVGDEIAINNGYVGTHAIVKSVRTIEE